MGDKKPQVDRIANLRPEQTICYGVGGASRINTDGLAGLIGSE